MLDCAVFRDLMTNRDDRRTSVGGQVSEERLQGGAESCV